jgi:5,5'-dehydrodivanillate O-demethylase oxygenase subunit
MMAWVRQGSVTDRSLEHLGKSDVGVAMMRHMFKQWINCGFSRYSPQKDDLLALYVSAASAREGSPAGA